MQWTYKTSLLTFTPRQDSCIFSILMSNVHICGRWLICEKNIPLVFVVHPHEYVGLSSDPSLLDQIEIIGYKQNWRNCKSVKSEINLKKRKKHIKKWMNKNKVKKCSISKKMYFWMKQTVHDKCWKVIRK